MSIRTRDWLRTFLHLGARAEKDGIPISDVERQENTVIRALNMLDYQPGIVLADEVGMGKTFEALGIAAAMRSLNPKSRVVVVTPGPDLNTKWFSEFARFREMYDFGEMGDEPVNDLAEFIQAIRKRPVVVAPVTMFLSGRGSGDQTYLLSLYFYWKELHGKTANAIMARYRNGNYDRFDVSTELFLGLFTLAQVEPHLKFAFRRGRGEGALGLDDLYEKGGLAAFEHTDAVRDALYRARFVLTGKLIPFIDLLIIDEAHKLKNPESLRTRAMHDVFQGGFRKALFLTATPFQLDVSELREVFSLFSRAKGAPEDLGLQVDALLTAVSHYQHQYDEFQLTWSSLDPAMAAKFCAIYDQHTETTNQIDDPSLRIIAAQIEALKKLKNDIIEPGFRKWMIRSLRHNKRLYRQHLRNSIRPTGPGALPFLIYERFIAELFRSGRQTHKAAAEINMVSSYKAAQQGTLLSNEDEFPAEAETYRQLLRKSLSEIQRCDAHPKVTAVLSDALNAADHGEKTLIFCSRIATLEQLRRELDDIWELRLLARWRQVFPESDAKEIFDSREGDDNRVQGRHSLLQGRFHRSQDALYLALREPYVRTLSNSNRIDWALLHLATVVKEANNILSNIRVGKTAAERLDYQIAKRCVEQAVARLFTTNKEPTAYNEEIFTRLLDEKFVHFGFDLLADKFEGDSIGEDQPTWEITERTAQLVLGDGGSLWERLSDILGLLSDAQLRVRVVEQLSRYLTYKQVPFLADLLNEAHRSGLVVDPIESDKLLAYMPHFWQTKAGEQWLKKLREFLHYFLQRDIHQQKEILDGPIKTGTFARHTRDGESRERLREAFNTPLFPMVLIANEVMQEGLDLHKQCRRIVHHDLVWNPAQIEQRVGRIDRLGSLTNRLRLNDTDVTLDVLYPVINGTIDDRLYRTVKTREKWLEFLLGAAPNFSEYSFAEVEPPPLPERLSVDLAIDLGPE